MIPIPSEADTAVQNDPRWLAVQKRDRTADGRFFYSVETTGVYCRPSCPSRRPRPRNVTFHDTAGEAERAGFRPCKRCRPREPSPADREAEQVAALCRWIEQQQLTPTLAALATRSGWSPFHTHRMFKRVTGLTPKAYAAAHRAERLRGSLEDSPSVTRAIYDSGYGSPARFYEQSAEVLGMTPTEYRRGGRDRNIRFAVSACSLGSLLVAATEMGVCAISLGDDPDALSRALRKRFPHAASITGDADFDALVARVVELVEHPWASIELPLDVRGTAFQKRVWQALRGVRAGSTVSYAELARAVDRPDAIRAVAGACAANSLAVAIPCHRVLRSDGELSGYRWGVARKRELLERERRES